jgi:HD-GYP domain-containing protein (c-di-GMP phosphodiesterase class II)
MLALADRVDGERIDAAQVEQLAHFASGFSSVLETSRIRQRERATALASVALVIDRMESAHPFLAGHSRRVARTAEILGRRAGLGRADLDDLLAAAWLHDVGRIGFDAEALGRPGPLVQGEWLEMDRHPVQASRLAREAGWGEAVEQAIRHHRESWSGGGRPNGLREEAIPLASRILALADAYDALGHPRPWRGALPEVEIVAQLRADAGRRYDPALVDLLLECLQVDVGLQATGS